ncbi:hypothetical protein ACIP5Y_17655 [Nocardia sp. NPDC088792]|uniref:hypothetical protein n=1 Tax=Nocardia sp. NPDC088792 TaxID=3364332 RepID=UPI0037FECB13
MVEFAPDRMRELATYLRERADAIAGKAPVALDSRLAAQGLKPQMTGLPGSRIAVSVEETLKTLDTMLEYHAARLRQTADKTDSAAASLGQPSHRHRREGARAASTDRDVPDGTREYRGSGRRHREHFRRSWRASCASTR